MTQPRLPAAAARSPRRGWLVFLLALAVASAAALLAVNLDGNPASVLHSLVSPARSHAPTATHSPAEMAGDGSLPDVFREITAADSGDDATPIVAATTWPAP